MIDKGLHELSSSADQTVFSVSDVLMAANPNNRAFRTTKHLNNAAVESLRARDNDYVANMDEPTTFAPITRDQLERRR